MKVIAHQRLDVITGYQLHHYQIYNDFFFIKDTGNVGHGSSDVSYVNINYSININRVSNH